MDTVDINIFDLPDLVIDGFVPVPATVTDGAVGATNCDSAWRLACYLVSKYIFKNILSQNHIHG